MQLFERNDRVFQLSLTEIAFLIAFILLLLLGFLVSREQDRRLAAEAERDILRAAPGLTAQFDDAIRQVTDTLGTAATPTAIEAVLTKLVEAERAGEERRRLLQRVKDLQAELTALQEIRAAVDGAAAQAEGMPGMSVLAEALALHRDMTGLLPGNPGASNEEATENSDARSVEQMVESVREALAAEEDLRNGLQETFGMHLTPENRDEAIKTLLIYARQYRDLLVSGLNPAKTQKENVNLRGQVAYLKGRLEARGGRDYPPCWADEKTGRVEPLLAVELHPSRIAVAPAWPPHREAEALAMATVPGLLAASPVTYARFGERVKPIFDASVAEECRHYVVLKSVIADAVQSDRSRLFVERYFYKIEVRR